MKGWPPTAALLLLCAAAGVVGCGLQRSASSSSLSLTVTTGFGSHQLPPPPHPSAGTAQTALSLLEANYPVSLSPTGKVEGIDGIRAGAGEVWTLFVDGVTAEKNPARLIVRPGEAYWWDLHPQLPGKVIGVVGAFPEPFLSGIEGKRYPVRVECTSVTSKPCRLVLHRIERLGVPAGLSQVSAAGETPYTLRLAVGPWPSLRHLVAASYLEAGPSSSGVAAILSGAGDLLLALAPDGRIARSFGPGAGLIATVSYPTEAPLWLVTGTDEAGVLAAAEHLDEAALRNHYAIAVSPAGEVVPLPVVGKATR